MYTGDIATMDADGYFYIVDRKKDMILSGGYNVYPRDIDEVYYGTPKLWKLLHRCSRCKARRKCEIFYRSQRRPNVNSAGI